jgi:hypothetical protein
MMCQAPKKPVGDYLEGWGARYSIFERISSGILDRRLVSVFIITHVLRAPTEPLSADDQKQHV